MPVACSRLVVGTPLAQDAGMAPRFHTLRIEEVSHETADAVVLRFAVPEALRDAYRFVPGQYLTLRATIDGEDMRRSYSICSGPGDAGLAVAIKRIEGGVFSSWANSALQEGDAVAVMTPDGRFALPPADVVPGGRADGRTVAAFAAGSGITPILSILRSLLVNEANSRFFLFYGNRSTSSIMFRSVLEDLKDRFIGRLSVFHVLSREQRDLPALNGRLDGDKLRLVLRASLPPSAIDQVLVCGPQPMIEGLPSALTELGVAASRIHVERFTPAAGTRPRAAPVAAQATPAATATIIHEGIRTDLSVAAGETLIDAAIRAGRALPYSCKGGMCCTCRARLLEGQATMTTNYSLEPWETEAGYILTCQAIPTSLHVVVDYDQV
jgi:ring-1,2-phenylacetyl-CoA epoxidase subunit PaaE